MIRFGHPGDAPESLQDPRLAERHEPAQLEGDGIRLVGRRVRAEGDAAGYRVGAGELDREGQSGPRSLTGPGVSAGTAPRR